jgi:hypothetical protein
MWTSTALFMALYFMSSLLHPRRVDGRGAAALELLDLLLLLGWSTAALGFRPSISDRKPNLAAGRVPAGLEFPSSAAALGVGVTLADTLVVVVGSLLVALVGAIPLRSMGELGLVAGAAAVVGAATSLQFEIVRTFSRRAGILIVTALITVATLQVARADLPGPVALLRWLVFPVSGLASATEEPLRLELAARALSAGAVYDLALIAVLLALPGHRARG